MPLISVILPAYNGAPTVEQCLKSLFSQTLREIEILAIDNGSTDAGGEVLRDYAERDARLRVISQSPNIGPSGARNLGLDRAGGEYIAFCDCDDEVLRRAV